jgi:hypothetical protein
MTVLLSLLLPEVRAVRAGWLAVLLLATGGELPAHAQTEKDLRQQAVRDVAGPDAKGSDGPLQAVGFSLALRHRLHEAGRVRPKVQRAVRLSLPPSLRAERDAVPIDALATNDGQTLRRDLEALGLQNAAVAGRIVSGRLPVGAIDEAAALPTLHSAWPLLARSRAGVTTTQGAAAMYIDSLRQAHDVDGSGVRVGALSDSYNNAEGEPLTTARDDVESGDLPQGVDVLDEADDPQSDEGRALLQIIHDLAPGADLAFHTAFDGLANFVQGIRDLADAGADVIIDDIIFLSEPMFQDGLLAQMVDEVAFGDDVVYVSSAGNAGQDAYAQAFRGSGETGPLGGELHDYDPGSAVDTGQEIVIHNGTTVQIALHWDQPSASAGGPGARTDMEVALRDKQGTVLAAERRNNIRGNPFEFASLTNRGQVDADQDGVPDSTFQVSVERLDGPAPNRIHYVLFAQDGDVQVTEFDTNSPTLYGHSNARGTLSTAAAAFFNTPAFGVEPPRVNDFSSVGGVPVRFDHRGTRLATPEQRNNPDLAAPDGGNTTFFGQRIGDGDTFPNFFGTSAAAAHAAGIAALVREAVPSAPADAVIDRLRRSAIDIRQTARGVPTGRGPDAWSGAGLVDARRVAVGPPEVASFSAEAGGDRTATVQWTEGEGSTVASYTLEQSFLGGPFQTVETVAGGQGTYRRTVSDLSVGAHDFRLRLTRPGGTTEVGPQARATIRAASTVSVRGPFPNPTQDQFTLELTINEEQGVLMFLYDVLGRQLSVEFRQVVRADRPRRVRIDVPSRYGSGLYFVRIVGERFDTAVPVRVVR